MRKVVVVGGGIAGLSAAYYLQRNSVEKISITLLEAAPYWGGKLVTERVSDAVPEGKFVIEGGPDTFVVTKPWGVRLCKELGIADRLRGTNPETKKTYILKNKRLHELPGGLTMMIPTEFAPMLRTGLLSWPAKARMGLDFFLPAAKRNGDESMGEFVTRRLGRPAYENLIEPLMSGIYAGDGDRLSLQATLPYLRELEIKYGGLVKGALAVRRERRRKSDRSAEKANHPDARGAAQQEATPGSRSIFLTPITGLAEIVEALLDRLCSAGVDLRLNSPVEKIVQADHEYMIQLADGTSIGAEALVLATPAYASAALIEDFAPALAAELEAIEYVSTATVTLAFQEQDLPRPLDGYGYVIPRCEGRKALACTWTSTKFPHRAPVGYALVRVFIGRAGQEGQIGWGEQELLAIARQELQDTLGITAQPHLTRIYRWEKAMPQYNLGHPERLERMDAILEAFPSLALAGNGYQGIGIPDCIHSGELAAERLVKYTSITTGSFYPESLHEN